MIFPSKIAMWHAHIREDHLYPTRKLHSGTFEDETGAFF